jgi:hypothetical protein
MKVGDRVQWTSQSLGFTTTKRGTVIAVVPAGRQASFFLPEGFKCNSSAGYGFSGYGFSRKHESYLVQVDGKGKRAYWPLVKHLTREK